MASNNYIMLEKYKRMSWVIVCVFIYVYRF